MSEADWGHIATILGGAAVFVAGMTFMFGVYWLCK